MGCPLPCNRSSFSLEYTYIRQEKIDIGWGREDFDFAISIWAKNFQIEDSEEIIVCDSTCLLGEVGGNIGLYLGVSVITLVDILFIILYKLEHLVKIFCSRSFK
ncbi:acid-sensing ion channel 4 [Eurytemora carolleeae]|uniref:acid-sensing ion channel 4 n=1 Tax=Eurytemora carolleeae TaxID=1294199 RepID=UPI000C778ABD|nr:acid-sensing ion channel 4 [Eurytemora carolleeae]|eukprot:XP_023326275.1 acid-sensing ion channel 4-like [Eurytemora affinis]